MWELQVKFYLGRNEDCSPGDSVSDSSEKLLWGGEGRPGCTAILQQMADVWQKPASYCQASIFQYFFLSWLLIKENEISQVKGFEHFPMYGKMLPMYGKMQESGLTETIPLTCTSAVWGQHAVFLHAEFSQGST